MTCSYIKIRSLPCSLHPQKQAKNSEERGDTVRARSNEQASLGLNIAAIVTFVITVVLVIIIVVVYYAIASANSTVSKIYYITYYSGA